MPKSRIDPGMSASHGILPHQGISRANRATSTCVRPKKMEDDGIAVSNKHSNKD
jgi:hypothetical protein